MSKQIKKRLARQPAKPKSKLATALDETEYRAAVARCKAAIATISSKQWVLGDEAVLVTKKYGENRLEQFAVDINFHGAACTLARYRSVCLAFRKTKTGGRPLYFAAAQILQGHPDRIKIVTANPKISARAARELMHKGRAETARGNGAQNGAQTNGAKQTATAEQENIRETKGWFKQVVIIANEAIEAAEVRRCTPEQLRDLLAAKLEPDLFATVRQGGEALLALADWLDELFDDAAETLKQEGRVRTSPQPAAVSVQSASVQPAG